MTSVCSGERVAAQSRDEGKVKAENVLQPFDSRGGLVGKDFDEVWSGLISSGLDGVVVELLDGVANGVIDLGSSEGAVDAGGGFGGVATEEV